MTVDTIDSAARLLRRSQRLMDATRSVHESLDTRIIGAQPLRDRQRYVRLLEMQYRFHRDVDALYTMAPAAPVRAEPAHTATFRIGATGYA